MNTYGTNPPRLPTAKGLIGKNMVRAQPVTTLPAANAPRPAAPRMTAPAPRTTGLVRAY